MAVVGHLVSGAASEGLSLCPPRALGCILKESVSSVICLLIPQYS